MKYIADSLGSRYADPVLLNLETMLAESTVRTPMICLLSMGSDPTNQICELAKKMNLECRCISMGQGQEIHARRLLQLAREQGSVEFKRLFTYTVPTHDSHTYPNNLTLFALTKM